MIGYFLTGNTHPFCQSTGTMRQVNNNASHSSQCFGHLFDVQEVKYMFSSIKRSQNTLNVVPETNHTASIYSVIVSLILFVNFNLLLAIPFPLPPSSLLISHFCEKTGHLGSCTPYSWLFQVVFPENCRSPDKNDIIRDESSILF